jgi:hypothetical protein
VVSIIGSHEEGHDFKSDTETGSPECVLRVFSSKYPTMYLKWKRQHFLPCFSV